MSDLILVPTDFSEVCANAINYGAEMAKNLKHNLCLLHVIDRSTKTWLKKEGLQKTAVDEKLDEIAKKIKAQHGLVVQTVSREGNIFETIGDVAEETEASLMLLGTHGKIGMQKLTGSYALRVITDSPIPVIVVQDDSHKKSFDNIVFPVDSTYATRQKVSWAVYIAKKYNSTINIFQIKETAEDLKYKLRIVTDQITKVFDEKGIKYKVTEASREGTFALQVNDFARYTEADLIMIMTNTNENIPVFSLGPWDEKILFNPAGIPVMCINPHEYDHIIIGG